MIYFTADEHYGHRNIIEFCKRPFQNIDDMTDGLIARHNSRVGEGDTVYHLGDMFWRSFPDAISVMGRLNGTHHYVWGNHEEVFEGNSSLADRFKTIGGPRLIKVGKQKIWIAHFAHRVWPKSGGGSWHLWGHSHNELPPFGLSFDVGVDCWDYYPVSINQIAFKMGQMHGETYKEVRPE